MNIIGQRKKFFFLSGFLVAVSLILFFAQGLKLGIDFTGGALVEVDLNEAQISPEEAKQKLSEAGIAGLNAQISSEGSILVRFPTDGDEKNLEIKNKIENQLSGARVIRTEFISSMISSELKNKTGLAILFAILGIILYIAWAFRKVSYPIKSWKYGLAAIIALAHDIIITVGIFVLLGKFFSLEIGVSFVAALLTILGYSVNDTIVVFDRIRENLLRAGSKEDFEGTVNRSINQTLGRSINTSLTVMLVLLALVFLGGASLFEFSLALLVGIFFGTYSSIFVASAFLVELWKKQQA